MTEREVRWAAAQDAVARRLEQQGVTPEEIDPEEWRELVREEEEKIQEMDLMSSMPEASQIDHDAESAEARWQALVARIEQATAVVYVCDQLMADLLTDGHPLCAQLGALCENPPDFWEVDEIAALMSTLEAAALGKAMVRAMAAGMVQYLANLSTQEA